MRHGAGNELHFLHMRVTRFYLLWLFIVCAGLGPYLAVGDEEDGQVTFQTWRRKLPSEEIGMRCQDFVALHDRTEPLNQPMIDPLVRQRFLQHWKKVELEYRSPRVMFEFYNIYVRTVTPPDAQDYRPRGGSREARERYVTAESFDRLKIIERFLPFLRNADEVDDLASELYLYSHETLLKSYKIMNSVAGYMVAQSFRQSGMREFVIKYVWENLSQVTGGRDEIAKAFKATYLMKSPKEGEHSPLERLMDSTWVDQMSDRNLDDLSMPDGEELPSHEAEVLGKVIERRTLINAIRLVRERFLSQPGNTSQRWDLLEQVFWAEFNREEIEVKSLEEYGRRIGVSAERMRQLKVKLLHRVYKTYSNLVKSAWFAAANPGETGLED